MTTPQALTDAEWRLMDSAWTRPESTAREIHDDVAGETGWAYTTVKTMLTRLVEKGVLDERKQGLASVYVARLTQPQARRAAVRGLLDRAFDGAFGSLVHFFAQEERLTDEQRRELADLLERGQDEPRPPAPVEGAPPRKGGRRGRRR